MFARTTHVHAALHTHPALFDADLVFPGLQQPVASTAGELVAAVRRIAASEAPAGWRLRKLRAALDQFVDVARMPSPRTWRDTTGRYTRVLLNDPGEDFQIVAVFWPPGARSAIHDHDDTLGAVMPLFGEVSETKYRVDAVDGEAVDLTPVDVRELRAHTFSEISGAPGMQLHDMVNRTCEWAATLHVYLRGIDTFHVYAADPEGGYRQVEKQLWFDYEGGWRRWDDAEPHEPGRSTLEGHGTCLCGSSHVNTDARPALELVCHCTDCQKASGAPSLPLAFFPTETVELTGEIREHAHRNDSGHVVTRTFCGDCGTTLLHGSSSTPHLVAIPVGTLDDTAGFDPTTDIYVGSAPHWARARAATVALHR